MYSRVVWYNTSASMLLVAMVSVYKCEPEGLWDFDNEARMHEGLHAEWYELHQLVSIYRYTFAMTH